MNKKKGIILLLATIIIILISVSIFSKEKVDLADYTIINYETDTLQVTPTLTGTWTLLSNTTDYNQQIDDLVSTGIYTEDEAKKLIPEDGIAEKLQGVVTNYEFLTTGPFKNGDVIQVKIHYNEDAARNAKLKITNDLFSFEIKGLLEPVTQGDITDDLFNQIEFSEEDALSTLEFEDSFYDMHDNKVVQQQYFLELPEEDSSDGSATISKAITIQQTSKPNTMRETFQENPSDDVSYITYSEGLNVYKNEKDVWVDTANYQSDYNFGDMNDFEAYQNEYGAYPYNI